MHYLVHQLHMDGLWLDFQDKIQSLVTLCDPCQCMCVSAEYTKFIGV
jgi:hypothetical protein